MKNYLNIDGTMKVFIKQDKIQLLKWLENYPGYKFKAEFFFIAITSDSMDIAFYFFKNQQNNIEKNK